MNISLKAKLAMCTAILPLMGYAQVAGDYRSVASGIYSSAATWEKYDGSVWNPATSAPGSAANVTVKAGHNIQITGTSNSLTLLVESGASIKSDAAGQRSLRVYGGSLTNNGTIGGGFGDDSVNLEVAINGGAYTLSGSGVTKVNRLRAYYGLIGTNIVIDQDATFSNASSTGGSGVGLSAYYNSSTGTIAGENVTVTINAGRTINFLNAAVLHFASITTANTAGTYTYNINGVADMSSSMGTASFIPNSNNASSLLKVNVAGVLKFGQGFNTVSTGTGTTFGNIELDIAPGGIVDASATAKMTTGTSAFTMMDGTSIMKRVIGAQDTLFPIAATANGYNGVIMNNSGTPDTVSIKLKNSFDFVISDPTKVVNRQWTLTESVAGGSNDSVKLMWLAADQASGFTPAGASIYIVNGTAQTENPAIITGTGTLADPYVAAIGGVTTLGKFYVGNPGLTIPNAVHNIDGFDNAVTVAPNPAIGKRINFNVTGLEAGSYSVAVINTMGQIVYTGEVAHSGTTSAHTIDLNSNLPAGSYQFTLNGAKTQAAVNVIIK